MLVMNIVKTIEQYNIKNVYFSEPIKNNIMNDGTFTRIIYSTNTFVLNGIFLFITLIPTYIDKYYNKYKYFFDVKQNKDIIDQLQLIESNILSQHSIKNKVPQYKIKEQLESGFIKFFDETINKSDNSFILKISGIWENDTNYGITYKFTKI